MKQLIQDVRSGRTSIVELPIPSPKPGTALVRTGASLVSAGTERMLVEFASKSLLGKARSRPDLVRRTLEKARREGMIAAFRAARARLDQPMPLGYSSAGTIAVLGEGVSGFRVGDRVACAGGGFAVHAEYAVVPKNLMVHLPDSVDFESAAFTTLGATALHGFRLAGTQLGESVAVIGLGVLGQLAAGVANAAGCRVLGVDLDPQRVEVARQQGLAAVLRSEVEEASAEFTQGTGFDAVLICADTASNDPTELAGRIARDRGRIVALGAVGMEIPRRLYFEKELTFHVSRSYGPGRYDPQYEEMGRDYPFSYVRWTEGRNLEAFVSLLASGEIDPRPLISHRFPIEQAPDAYRVLTRRQEEPSLGILVTFPQQPYPSEVQKLDLSSRPLAPAAPVRLGVFGAGNYANAVLFPILHKLDGLQLVGLATPTGTRAEHAGRRYGFRYITSEEQQLLEDERINTIAVLTRHHMHASQTAAALKAGKHVFCEKPLALDIEQLTEAASAVENADGMLVVGFNRRFAPLLAELKRFFAPLHEPLVMNYRINALPLALDHWLHDPQQGGGRIIGEACHFIDCLTFISGSLPLRATASGLPDSKAYLEDNVIITLEFADGSVGSITYLANGDRSLPKERLEVFGGRRSAVLDDFRSLETHAGGRRRVRRAWFGQDKGHRRLWEAYISSLASGGAPPIPYRELFAVSQASFAALQALRSGSPVSVEPLSLDG